MPGARRRIAAQPVRAPPDRGEYGLGEGLQDQQAAALGAGEAHRAEAGQEGGTFGGGAQEGEEQGQDRVSRARRHRGRVDAFGAGLEGGVDVTGAFLRRSRSRHGP